MHRRRQRDSARVVVVDEVGSVLLLRVEDPEDAGPPVWITPGGGIEHGESEIDAAVRELFEETGLSVSADDLGAPVAVTRGDWSFRGEPLRSVDWFFALCCPRFEPSVAGWSRLELELHSTWRWWTADELQVADETVLPAQLAELARRVHSGSRPSRPIELPWLAV